MIDFNGFCWRKNEPSSLNNNERASQCNFKRSLYEQAVFLWHRHSSHLITCLLFMKEATVTLNKPCFHRNEFISQNEGGRNSQRVLLLPLVQLYLSVGISKETKLYPIKFVLTFALFLKKKWSDLKSVSELSSEARESLTSTHALGIEGVNYLIYTYNSQV